MKRLNIETKTAMGGINIHIPKSVNLHIKEGTPCLVLEEHCSSEYTCKHYYVSIPISDFVNISLVLPYYNLEGMD